MVSVVWGLPDDPRGNVWHCAQNGITQEEVEEVLDNYLGNTTRSRTSNRWVTFGYTRSGKHICVVWEELESSPLVVYPVTAYETAP